MTNSGRVRWTLLCEDRRHEQFFRGLGIQVLGCAPEKILPAPKGKGAASAWVLHQYPDHVRRTVRRYPSERVALIAVIDGDHIGFRERARCFDESLVSCSEPKRNNERIAICIPSWEIETWVAWLCGWRPARGSLDESRSFKSEVEKDMAHGRTNISAALAAWSPPLPDEEKFVPSLTQARNEIDRILR